MKAVNTMSNLGCQPPLILTPSLWGEEEIELTRPRVLVSTSNLDGLTGLKKKKRKYLNKHYLPIGWKVEGIEEFPVNLPYEGAIPESLVGTGAKHTGYHPSVGLHNFAYDHLNERWWYDIEGFARIAKHYGCSFGLDFSPLVNGRRCEVVEAIRRNRTFTASMQASGYPMIQSATFGHPKHNKFVFDGLAPNAPVAIEHIRTSSDFKQRKFFRMGVEALVEQKNPSILLVLGFLLDFDPGVPVKYYPCHIQKLRAL